MGFFGTGIRQGWHLLVTGNPYIWRLIRVTLEVTGVSTGVAVVIGVPIGLALGLGRFRGRAILVGIANAGLSLPPVLVGLVLFLLMFPAAPLGRFHLYFTLRAVYLAQTILAVPIIAALTSSAVTALPGGLVEQARGFGASRSRIWLLALREARVGVMAAVIVAVGSSLSEVGAVVLVGGNIYGYDQTLASGALFAVDNADYSYAVAIAMVLLVLILLVVAALTFLQQRGRRAQLLRSLH